MKTGTKIRYFRKARSFTQSDIAYELNLSQRAYSKIENNEVQVKVNRLEKIAKLLHVDLHFLLPGNGLKDELLENSAANPLINEKEREFYKKTIAWLYKDIDYLKSVISAMLRK